MLRRQICHIRYGSSSGAKGRLFVCALLTGLFLMNGLAVLSLSHEVHHHSHGAGMHHSGLCAWYCAAGQAVEVFSVQPETTNWLLDILTIPQIHAGRSAIVLHAYLRGPPLSVA